MNSDPVEKLKDTIKNRACTLLKAEKDLFKELRAGKGEYEFILAGNSLNNSTVNDLDIYGAGYDIKEKFKLDSHNKKTIFSSKNACSLRGKVYKVQFCSYWRNSLKELIESFDFSKIQVGVRAEFSAEDSFCIKEVYFSNAYLDWKLNETFDFMGSEYPLSSLFRLFKYFKREDCTIRERNICILKILDSIIRRGFKDYDDFKNQLDAIDLMLLPDSQEAFDFYQVLEDANLVREKRPVKDKSHD